MENLGKTASYYAKNGFPNTNMAKDCFIDCLNSLELLHDAGFIHMDIKPSNICMRGKQALLIDFGFALNILTLD